MNPLDRLTAIISELMGKEPSDPDVLKAVVEVVMAMREPSPKMASVGMHRLSDLPDDADWVRLVQEACVMWREMIDALLTEGEG